MFESVSNVRYRMYLNEIKDTKTKLDHFLWKSCSFLTNTSYYNVSKIYACFADTCPIVKTIFSFMIYECKLSCLSMYIITFAVFLTNYYFTKVAIKYKFNVFTEKI